jgi:hypothetical protein
MIVNHAQIVLYFRRKKCRLLLRILAFYFQVNTSVMKIHLKFMHIDVTIYTVFVPRIWFQVSVFRCQER